ncbi:hypothetical protein AOLI_G00016540 [Acnodon oligacanthus]
MCFSQKLLMERILLLAVMPAVLLTGLSTTTPNNTSPVTDTTSPNPTTTPCVNTITLEPNHINLPPVLARVKVEWGKTSPCHGRMLLSLNFSNTKPICVHSAMIKKNLGNELCEERRCGKFREFKIYSDTSKIENGYIITKNLTVLNDSCPTMSIACSDNNELLAYKVATGFLLVLVLAVILFRFAWPTYIAVRKRFSQKRQNRWIGPTQSQSVSYHRGQAGQLKNDTVKRQSYPGLERLSVNPSREPSSNRNSDYDSYAYN